MKFQNDIKAWQQSIMQSSSHPGITHLKAHKDGWTCPLTFTLCYHSLYICSCCCCAVHVADLLHSSVLSLPAVKSLHCSTVLAHVLQGLKSTHTHTHECMTEWMRFRALKSALQRNGRHPTGQKARKSN